MNQPPDELQKLLRHIDELIAQAPDAAARQELERMRARLDSPEMLHMARDLAGSRPGKPEDLVLEFHDPLLPTVLTASACVIAAAACLFALVEGFEHPTARLAGAEVNFWVMAAFAGACSVAFTALSFMRTFSVRFDTVGMVSRVGGSRWKGLRVGALPWQHIRSLRERPQDRVLEVHAASGRTLDIPMRVVNYPILRQHLENMVRLYGEPTS